MGFATQNLPILERVSLLKTYPFMNGFRLVYYNNAGILCVCLSVCVLVCLSRLRSREWDVVVPRFLQ